MAGAVFIISVPSEEFEKVLVKRVEKKVQQDILGSKSKDGLFTSTKKYPKVLSEEINCEKSALLSNNMGNDCNYESVEDSRANTKFKHLCMQKIMENLLKHLNIENSIWSRSLDKNYMQIMFTLQVDNLYEEVLEILKEYDIGSKYNSAVSVVPCTLHYETRFDDLEGNGAQSDEEKIKLRSKNSGWPKFLLSVRARLTVGQVVENIKTKAALTFEFIFLLLIASIICAIGLVENNNVYLISSMLISPMMGPVMASTFGKVIRDRILQKMGVYNELISVGIATVIGFIYGGVICICTDKYGETDWPTMEMISRGQARTIGVGCLIALLSGAAVALAVLSDNISSLVGVAISTSLMPPAVNAGLLWSLSSVYYITGNETTRYSSLTYTNYYFNDRAMELISLGAASLCLTFVNIICIYIAGILVFKIKEVAPIASRDLSRRQFWNHDIKIARNYNKTISGNDTRNIQEDLRNGFAVYRENICRKKFHGIADDLHHSTDLTFGTDKIHSRRSQYTWSPCTIPSEKPTMHEVRALYNNIVKESDVHQRLNLTPSIFNADQFLPLESEISAAQTAQENLIPKSKISYVNDKDDKKHLKKAKKFVVTPCIEPTTSDYP